MLHKNLYSISEIRPYINWLYLYHAWGLSGKPKEEKDKLRADAEDMLNEMETLYHTHSLLRLCRANSDGDDIVLDGIRMPMLRQQHECENGICLSLADFVIPLGSREDCVGVFATTVDIEAENHYITDPYRRMLAQTLADRLAEATAELLHLNVRKTLWGYAKDENLTIDELLAERFCGIRPAIGYPSLPDTSLNFIIDRLLSMRDIGIWLTESGAMKPHASVSGLMISHPKAHYFDLGNIGEDQLQDYAHRRGIPIEMARKYLRH